MQQHSVIAFPNRTIGLLVYDFRASGVVRNAFRIADAARKSGLDVRLWPIRPQGELSSQVPQGVPVEPILGKGHRQRDIDSFCAIPALARTLRERRPAILFSVGNHMHIHAALAMRRTGMAGSVRFIGRASNAVISLRARFWGKLLRRLERFQYAAMDRIVAVSRELRVDIAEGLGLPPAKMRTIPNGVDIAAVEELAHMAPYHRFFERGGPPVVLAAGRYAKQKNYEQLVRAFASAQAVQPLRLLIVGPGKERHRAKLRKLAAQLGVLESTAFEGFVANPFAYMRRADLFVLCSKWEGASNVLIEALACGCPVVATRVPAGIVEVMEDGRVGPLVPPGDPDKLAQAMLLRIGQPRASQSLIDRARDYDLSQTLAAYVDLLFEELALSREVLRQHA